MIPAFPTDSASIQARIEAIDPQQYSRTRNDVLGKVTYLSPYISRGAISTRTVWQHIRERGYPFALTESLLKELLWRDYFQQVARYRDIEEDIRQPQSGVRHHQIPVAIVEANTGIRGVDSGLQQLMQTGYMHNHVRMYVASLCCNIAGAHWKMPARWMYYYLLDGDPASNFCSWQWVAGSNSSKKYYANQENISQYTHEIQTGTYLDVSYEQLPIMKVPDELRETIGWQAQTELPASDTIRLDPILPTLLYNYFQLDRNWHAEEPANRILLLEPDWFAAWPVHARNIAFLISLAREIPGIQIFTGSFDEFIQQYQPAKVIYKEHPSARHYRGEEEPRDWICPEVDGYFPSFFSYWKKVSRYLLKSTA